MSTRVGADVVVGDYGLFTLLPARPAASIFGADAAQLRAWSYREGDG